MESYWIQSISSVFRSICLVGHTQSWSLQSLSVTSCCTVLSLHVWTKPTLTSDYAATLLVQFVKDACNLYGAEFTVCNVHSLLHICDDAKKYGNLDSVSAFPYENHMKKLKKLMRQTHSPLVQIIKRIDEETDKEICEFIDRYVTTITANPDNDKMCS